MTQSVYTKK